MGGAAVTTIELYGRLLEHAGGGEHDAHVRTAAGRRAALPLRRWLAPAASADLLVVERAAAPVLDVGCGPGARRCARAPGAARPPASTSRRWRSASRGARRPTRSTRASFSDGCRARPGRAPCCSTATSASAAARTRLLARAAELLAPGGEAIVELDPPGAGSTAGGMRLEAPARCGSGSPGRSVDADAIAVVGGRAGLRDAGRFEGDGREFARLCRVAA